MQGDSKLRKKITGANRFGRTNKNLTLYPKMPIFICLLPYSF